VGAGDLGDAEERRGGLDHRDEPGRARRHAALGFDFVDDLGEQPHMLRAIHLGESQGHDARANRLLDIAHRKPQWPVDADHHIGAPARDDFGRRRYRSARPLLLGSGDAVFEI
jgi:hypothetical protein